MRTAAFHRHLSPTFASLQVKNCRQLSELPTRSSKQERKALNNTFFVIIVKSIPAKTFRPACCEYTKLDGITKGEEKLSIQSKNI